MINNYRDWISEQLDRTIEYSEYILESNNTQKMTWTSDEVEIMIPQKPLGILVYIDYKYPSINTSNRRERIEKLNLNK